MNDCRSVSGRARGAAALLCAGLLAAALAGCGEGAGVDDKDIPAAYTGFYNYPGGRASSAGTLEIRNNVASPVLLFTSEVAPENYIGTAGGLSSVRVNLPEEKFYTVVAVQKSEYEEKAESAARFSDLTYYSKTQPYSLAVTASEMGGAGQWIITNNTDYWVSFKKADQSGTVYAVAAPKAARIIVPVAFGKSYDYIPHFYRQLKYNSNVVALVEFDDTNQSDTVFTDAESSSMRTIIGSNGTTPKGEDINPAVLFTNSSDKSVRVYMGKSNQLTNGGMAGSDFVVISGRTYMFTSTEDAAVKQLTAGVSTNNITFEIPGQSDVTVTQDTTMQKNKVYHVTLNGKVASGYSTTVVEEDASTYFN